MSDYGIAPGVYVINGFKTFGHNIVDARAAYARLIAREHRATETPGVEWYTCPTCGKSVDVGSECPICAAVIPFMGEPVAISTDGNGLTAGVDF